MSRFDVSLPWWAWVLMGVGLAGFVAMVAVSIVRNRGMKRSLFASPYALWMIIFTIVPLVIIVYYALTDSSGHFTLDNLRNFWDSNYLRRMSATSDAARARYAVRGMSNMDPLIYSLWMAFLCTVICLLLGYPAAHIMADREFKLGPTLVILFVVPMWMNFLLRTIALMSIMEDSGLINNILEWIGIGRQKLLNNIAAVQVGMIYNFLPFMVFPIYNVLNKMDYKLSEAAMDLGCNKWQVFYKVTLPLSVPGVVSGITMVFMPAVTTFYISRLLGGGKVQLFGDLIEAKFLSTSLNEWNVGSALSLVMMILILLSLGLLNKVDPDNEGGGMV